MILFSSEPCCQSELSQLLQLSSSHPAGEMLHWGCCSLSPGTCPSSWREHFPPLTGLGAGRRLAEAFVFVPSAFPFKEQPCVGAGLVTFPPAPLPPCLFHSGAESPGIFCWKEYLLVENNSLPAPRMLCGWWQSAGRRSRSLGVFGSVLVLLFPAARCWRRRPAWPWVMSLGMQMLG